MVQTGLEPKIYRTSELAEILGVSRQTVERYIERFDLETETITYLNKPVRGIILTEEKIQRLREFKGLEDHPSNGLRVIEAQDSQEGVHDVRSIYERHADEMQRLMQKHEQEVRTLRAEALQLHEQLKIVEIEKARLEGQFNNVESLKQVIVAQQTAIDTSKTAIDALNNERQAIQYQLQKYRSEEKEGSTGRPWWRIWG